MISKTEKKQDVIIVGGGLAGSLLFQVLKQRQPAWHVLLLEKSSELCGSHTWSLHEGDIPPSLRAGILPLADKVWSEYNVHFPEYSRNLQSGYASFRSASLAQKTWAAANTNFQIRTQVEVQSVSLGSVVLGANPSDTNPETLEARWVIDCRGWAQLQGPLGYQKFLGLELEFAQEQKLQAPIIKDARVAQTDGYRFMYVLPFSSRHFLFEDTYYSNSPHLDLSTWESEILKYAKQQFSGEFRVLHREVGCLPLALQKQRVVSTPTLKLGAATGFYQPVTGYSFPQMLQTLEQLLKGMDEFKDAVEFMPAYQSFLRGKMRQMNFLFVLNRMLFLAAWPENRYIVLQRFYRLKEDLIHRFYRGDLQWQDRVRILAGKPPVSVWRALKAIFF